MLNGQWKEVSLQQPLMTSVTISTICCTQMEALHQKGSQETYYFVLCAMYQQPHMTNPTISIIPCNTFHADCINITATHNVCPSHGQVTEGGVIRILKMNTLITLCYVRVFIYLKVFTAIVAHDSCMQYEKWGHKIVCTLLLCRLFL